MNVKSFGSSTSKLEQLQMRFQQKQLQEREQKKSEINHMNELTTKNDGKARVRIDERRGGVGIDRSHPLKPISRSVTTLATNKTSMPDRKQASAALSRPLIASKTAIKGSPSATKNVVKATAFVSQNAKLNFSVFEHSDNLDDETFPDTFAASLNVGTKRQQQPALSKEDGNNNTRLNSRCPPLSCPRLTKLKTLGAAVHKAPSLTGATTTTVIGVASSPSLTSNRNQTKKTLTTTPSAIKNVPSQLAATTTNVLSNMLNDENGGGGAAGSTSLVVCRICKRHFAADRIAKHETICQKMMNSKRKLYDAAKHRIQGTDAENFQRRATTARNSSKTMASSTNKTLASSTNKTLALLAPKKSDWRRKHEEFIAAIRAAKETQAHLARGGRLADLPPPPPSDTSDYIQCPYCLRRFNEAAAERHIPKCATMLHNKPKPKPPNGSPSGNNNNKRRYM